MKPSMPKNGPQRRICNAEDGTENVTCNPYILQALRKFFAPELKAWQGEQSLKRVFWGYGVVGTIGAGVLYFMADQIVIRQILLVLIAAYMIWLLVSIWRSSSALDNIWSTFARLLVVVWAGNTVMVVTFLELDLIGRFLSY